MNDKTSEFVLKYKLTSKCYDFDSIVKAFLFDMECGLRGEYESLAMLPSYLTTQIVPIEGKKYVVADAGGTGFRCGLVSSESKRFKIELIRETTIPGLVSEITAKEFYDILARYMKEGLAQAQDIGFCFSYPVDMEPSLDGELVQFTKEIKCPDAVGRKVGYSLLKAIAEVDKKPRRIAVLNDAVAALLGGRGITDSSRIGGYIGFIYGTGINMCYEEKISQITKIGGKGPGRMIINIEAGNFDKLDIGAIDAEINAASVNPGRYRLEKMTAGRYVGELVSRAIIHASEEGLLKGEIDFYKIRGLSTKMASNFVFDKNSAGTITEAVLSSRDRDIVRDIVLSIIDRMAMLSAAVMAAVIIKSGQGKDRPVGLVAEGTTFDKFYGFRQGFEKHLKAYLEPKGISYVIIQGRGLNYIGAAIAAMHKEIRNPRLPDSVAYLKEPNEKKKKYFSDKSRSKSFE